MNGKVDNPHAMSTDWYSAIVNCMHAGYFFRVLFRPKSLYSKMLFEGGNMDGLSNFVITCVQSLLYLYAKNMFSLKRSDFFCKPGVM